MKVPSQTSGIVELKKKKKTAKQNGNVRSSGKMKANTNAAWFYGGKCATFNLNPTVPFLKNEKRPMSEKSLVTDDFLFKGTI